MSKSNGALVRLTLSDDLATAAQDRAKQVGSKRLSDGLVMLAKDGLAIRDLNSEIVDMKRVIIAMASAVSSQRDDLARLAQAIRDAEASRAQSDAETVRALAEIDRSMADRLSLSMIDLRRWLTASITGWLTILSRAKDGAVKQPASAANPRSNQESKP